MQRGTKRGVTLVLAVVMAVTLVGCVSLASQPEVPDVDDTNAILPPDPVLPFTEAEDITGSFTEENIDFSESISKEELVCTQIETSEYAQANKTVDLPNEDAEVMMKNRNKKPWYEIPEETDEPEEHKEENIMLLPHFRANFKTGYWEAVFSHTRPLGVVPWDMRG